MRLLELRRLRHRKHGLLGDGTERAGRLVLELDRMRPSDQHEVGEKRICTHNPIEDMSAEESALRTLSPPEHELSHEPIRGPMAP